MLMAFVSRHAPTNEQTEMAKTFGFELIHVGDADAFDAKALDGVAGEFPAVSVVHPASALHFYEKGKVVVVFQNASRPRVDGKPEFFCSGLKVFSSQNNTR